MSQHFYLAASWVGFCVLHSLLAALWFKNKIQKVLGSKYPLYRLLYTIFAFISFTAVIILQVSVTSFFIFSPDLFITIAGVVIGLPGILIMSGSVYKYFLRLTGLSWLIRNQSEKILMQNGIHQYVRHPLYLGTFLFIWGLFLIFPYLSLLITNVIITLYTLIGIRFEEKKLRKDFGDAYKQYQHEVPMIIPRFYFLKKKLSASTGKAALLPKEKNN